jgi:hypothetical protein
MMVIPSDLLGYKGKGGVSGYMRRHGYRWEALNST